MGTQNRWGAKDPEPSWPFAVWGVDILGPFPRAVSGYRFLYVAIDKFTKWSEVTPVVNITKGLAVAFLKSIVCRFGVPNRIIADNGTVRIVGVSDPRGGGGE